MYAHRAMSFFALLKAFIFQSYVYPGEIAYFSFLNQSFPMVYGLWSCIEIEMSIPLGAHVEIAYFNSPNGQLSNGVWVMALY